MQDDANEFVVGEFTLDGLLIYYRPLMPISSRENEKGYGSTLKTRTKLVMVD